MRLFVSEPHQMRLATIEDLVAALQEEGGLMVQGGSVKHVVNPDDWYLVVRIEGETKEEKR